MLRRLFLAIAFVFVVSPAFASSVLVIVDIQMQTMQVRVDGVTKYRWDVSTGRVGYDTPPGRFQPLRMHKKYFSKKYDNAPMPYAIFFHGGYAIHGTGDLKRLGRVASHGCVRLDPANAKVLFSLVQQAGMLNTVIRVRTHAQGLATVEEPEAPAIEEPAVVQNASAEFIVTDASVDEVVTGSAQKPATVSWLRKGING